MPSKSGKTVFAYMRRSTTKKEQASSLPQQEEWIELIAKALGISYADIKPYTESRSGYENRTRKEWQRMLWDIDKAKEPCTILCRDTSRLSRNPTDNLAIANRMFWDNKFKKSIWHIFYLGENFAISEWNEKTNKKHIVDTLHQNYTDSMENKEKCIAWVLLKLNMWEFPYCPPHWLSRVNKDGLKRTSRSEKTTLKQNEKMPFVRHAFEMKAKGKTAKEICKYLKEYGNINISTKSIVETLIANTVYKGVYTEKTTGTFFDNIKFWEWKPPIESDLWDRANAKVGKRGHGFGEWQADHIAQWILKHESGKNLYLYKAKGKYNAYQTEVVWEDGKRKSIGIMETALVKGFLNDAIPRIKYIYHILANGKDSTNTLRRLEDLPSKQQEETRRRIYDFYRDLYQSTGDERYNIQFHTFDECISYYKKIQDRNIDSSFELGMSDIDFDLFEADIDELFKDDFPEEIEKSGLKESMLATMQNSIKGKEMLKWALMQAPLFDNEKIEKEVRETQKMKLEQKKLELEMEKKEILKKAFKGWFSAEFANEMKEDTEKEIQEVQSQIDFLSESTNIEEYLDRLSEILQNLHELSSRVLCEADYVWWRDDIRQLMEIVLHELTLTNKKELKVKLLEGLENLETGKMWYGAINTTHTRTAIKEFVENYDRVKEKYTHSV